MGGGTKKNKLGHTSTASNYNCGKVIDFNSFTNPRKVSNHKIPRHMNIYPWLKYDAIANASAIHTQQDGF
jgi:hypothetical protein